MKKFLAIIFCGVMASLLLKMAKVHEGWTYPTKRLTKW
jgi:hypothetical protein